MLSLTHEQMAVFRQDLLHRVACRLAERLIKRHSDAVAGRGVTELAAELEPEIEFAHRVGLRSNTLLERYTDLWLTLGPNFYDRYPWVQDILRRSDLSPSTKMDWLEEIAVFVVLRRSR